MRHGTASRSKFKQAIYAYGLGAQHGHDGVTAGVSGSDGVDLR
jgi:hypothetical protein